MRSDQEHLARFIHDAFIAACRAELGALKPGNVHIHAGGHGMEIAHFEAAAEAAAPFVSDMSLAVGERIERAVAASFAVAKCNTNLGILLLCVPLAAAAGATDTTCDLRDRLRKILANLDRTDAEHVFRAIKLANPAGLGSADAGDVNGPATITLREAMAIAAERDRIARAFTTDYSDIFDFALPTLWAAQKSQLPADVCVTSLHLALLARYTDSHIARKHGLVSAEAVRDEARKYERLLASKGYTDAFDELLLFDASLKMRGLNPGTTADFVVATLFASALISQLATATHA